MSSGSNVHYPPLRSIDDFIFGSARFNLPNFDDWEKWGNRVVCNLLYYQTNYMVLYATIYTIMLILSPGKILCGLLVKAAIVFVIFKCFPTQPHERLPYRRWHILIGAVICGYIFLMVIEAVLLSAFTLLLPFAATFVHASFRLRNVRNKLGNALGNLNSSSPMGQLLKVMRVNPEVEGL